MYYVYINSISLKTMYNIVKAYIKQKFKTKDIHLILKDMLIYH